jgi:hypothetical protein
MLHHPFTKWDDPLFVDGDLYEGYAEAFRACCRLHSHPDDFYPDLKNEAAIKTAEEGGDGVELDEDDVPEEEDNYPLEAFEILAHRRPSGSHELPEPDLGSVGERELDRNYNWSLHVGKYNIPPQVWDQVKAETPTEQTVAVDSNPTSLNWEQRKL